MEKDNTILQDFRRRPLDWLLRVVTLVILALGAYITIRIYPLYEGLSSLDFRVAAIEKRNTNTDPLVVEFVEQRGTIKAMQEDIADIKQDVRDIKNFLNVR